jgi:hypothetical protein
LPQAQGEIAPLALMFRPEAAPKPTGAFRLGFNRPENLDGFKPSTMVVALEWVHHAARCSDGALSP